MYWYIWYVLVYSVRIGIFGTYWSMDSFDWSAQVVGLGLQLVRRKSLPECTKVHLV
jgi:hypothetical protein